MLTKTLLVPVQVEARVVNASTPAPAYKGAGSTLEKGVHVHWALPDALTKSRVVDVTSGFIPFARQSHALPAVPDLWLVVRLNPGLQSYKSAPAPAGAVAKGAPIFTGPINFDLRFSWKAWVVESRNGKAVPLDQWTPPGPDRGYNADEVLTTIGMKQHAGKFGHPGWGLYSDKDDFNAAYAAYYPECRNRFGFYDAVADLTNPATAQVSYVVYGWYRYSTQDPLNCASDRVALLDWWNFDIFPTDKIPARRTVITNVAETSELGTYEPSVAATAPSTRQRSTTNIDAGALPERVPGLEAGFDALLAAQGTSTTRAVRRGAISHSYEHAGLECHGAVLGVSLAPGKPREVNDAYSTLLYRSLPEAVAGVGAGLVDASNEKAQVLLSLIHDQDQKLRTLAGQFGFQNDLHALGFQAAAGPASYFAHMDVYGGGLLVVPHPGIPNVFQSHGGIGVPQALDPPPSGVETMQLAQALLLADGTLADAGKALLASIISARDEVSKAVPDLNKQFLRVCDHRRHHVSPRSGNTPSSPAGSTYWVNLADMHAVAQLCSQIAGAQVVLPTAQSVFEVPGPRWYRPWSPHLVITHRGRSYRHGFDGRFDEYGKLVCRSAGAQIAGLSVNVQGFSGLGQPVTGAELLSSPALLMSKVPANACSIVEEALLLDLRSAPLMALLWRGSAQKQAPNAGLPDLAKVEDAWRAFISNIALRNSNEAGDWDNQTWFGSWSPESVLPSPMARVLWYQPWAPLFANITYSFKAMSRGRLGSVDAELPLVQMTAQPVTHTEQRLLGFSIANVLESAMVTKEVRNLHGVMQRTNAQDQVTSEQLLRLDVLSTALVEVDEWLYKSGSRERSGVLSIDTIEIVDAFGSVETLSNAPASIFPKLTGSRARSNAKDMTHIMLPPRLTEWGRLQLRFMPGDSPIAAAPNPADRDADPTTTPVCGYLVPDLLEHTLELYDANGGPLGQLVSEAPIALGDKTGRNPGDPQTTPAVSFEPHPLASSDLKSNPSLLAFVEGITNAKQEEALHPDASRTFSESALTALMRVIDSVRVGSDNRDKHGERRVRLLGGPLALVRARVWFEATHPVASNGQPGVPGQKIELDKTNVSVPIKLGCATQPDDGVVGLFIPATAVHDARFRVADVSTATKAIKNELEIDKGVAVQAIAHRFIVEADGGVQDSTLTVASGTQRDVLLLVDIKGGIYATSGMFPRKHLTLPREQLSGALKTLSPSFKAGPVLAAPAEGRANPMLSVPNVPGFDTCWLQVGATHPEPFSPLPPVGELPPRRISLADGWIDLIPQAK